MVFQEKSGIEYADKIYVAKGGGGRQMLTLADKDGWGGWGNADIG